MLTEEFTNLISTICDQYSYVAHAKQYMGRDKRMYTQEAATADVLTRLVSDHASEYVPFASEVDLIKSTISQKLVESARQKKQKQTIQEKQPRHRYGKDRTGRSAGSIRGSPAPAGYPYTARSPRAGSS